MLLHTTPSTAYQDYPLPGLPAALSLEDPFSGLDAQSRPYQQRIVRKACQMFDGTHAGRDGLAEEPAASVLIDSPTGSGKTVMGLAIARYLQAMRGYRVGWAARRRNLLAQAARENMARGFDVDLVTISMFEKRPPKVDMLVVDEAHHDATMNMANLQCMIRPAVVLGLTATPPGSDRVRLCFDKVIKDCGIHRLIQDGYLSRYHHYTIREYTPQSVARHYLTEPDRWGKSLLFFHRQEQCDECLELLQAGGVRADVVTGKLRCQRQLDDFAAGRTDVLINMNILTEGFDCPELRTVFCRPSGRSGTIQMAGRVFRKHAGEPVKQVVQCIATRHPLVKTAMADQQFVWTADGWQSLTENSQIAAIAEVSRRRLAAAWGHRLASRGNRLR